MNFKSKQLCIIILGILASGCLILSFKLYERNHVFKTEQALMESTANYNAFEMACIQGDLAAVKSLYSQKSSFNLNYHTGPGWGPEDPERFTPLVLAIQHQHVDVVRFLLEHGADPNFLTDVGPQSFHKWHEGIQDESPLHIAARYPSLEIAELLLQHGAEINWKAPSTFTPLIQAIYGERGKGNPKMVKFLLDHGADPNLLGNDESPPLLNAVWARATWSPDEDSIKILLDHGADPNLQNRYGETPLQRATLVPRLSVIRALLEHKANPNIQDDKGKTPLFSPALQERVDILQELINYGADMYIRNKEGETAFDVAKRLGKRKSVDFFREAGYKENP